MRNFVTILVVAALTACGSDSPTAMFNPRDLEGDWFGQTTDSTGTAAVAWLLTSDGNRVVGHALVGGADIQCEGTIVGELNGFSLSFGMMFPPGSCPPPLDRCRIEYLGVVIVSATAIDGRYNVDDSCSAPITNGAIVLRR